MTGDREEQNRVLGFPVGRHPDARPAGKQRPPQAAQSQPRPGEEPQRVLGFPVDWSGRRSSDVLRSLLRRIRRTRGHG